MRSARAIHRVLKHSLLPSFLDYFANDSPVMIPIPTICKSSKYFNSFIENILKIAIALGMCVCERDCDSLNAMLCFF